MLNKTSRFLVPVLLLMMACTGAKVVSDASGSSNSLFPSWYQVSSFAQDSTSYAGYATSIAADSAMALNRAEGTARAQLESHIAKEFEEFRRDLATDASSTVWEPGFIMMLRNAHNNVESEANVDRVMAVKTEKGYRGFAKVSITKENLYGLMEQGFRANSNYWKVWSSSEAFQSFVSEN